MRRLAIWPQLACKLASLVNGGAKGDRAEMRPSGDAVPTLDERLWESTWPW